MLSIALQQRWAIVTGFVPVTQTFIYWFLALQHFPSHFLFLGQNLSNVGVQCLEEEEEEEERAITLALRWGSICQLGF